MNELKWEQVLLSEPTITVSNNYIYFNACARDLFHGINGFDFYIAVNSDGNKILSIKDGKQFLTTPKKNETRIVCKELVDYILSVYGKSNRFKLEENEGYYILVPCMK